MAAPARLGYSFNDYVGVSLGVEFTSQYNQPSRFTQIDGYEAELLRSERGGMDGVQTSTSWVCAMRRIGTAAGGNPTSWVCVDAPWRNAVQIKN